MSRLRFFILGIAHIIKDIRMNNPSETLAQDVLDFAVSELKIELKSKPTVRVHKANIEEWKHVWYINKYGVVNPTEAEEHKELRDFNDFKKINFAVIYETGFEQKCQQTYSILNSTARTDTIAVQLPNNEKLILAKEDRARMRNAYFWAIEKAQGQDNLIVINGEWFGNMFNKLEKDGSQKSAVIIALNEEFLKGLIHEVLHILERNAGEIIVKHRKGEVHEEIVNEIYERYTKGGRLEQLAINAERRYNG